MSTEIYDKDGRRVLEMYSTGNALEVYVWDTSAVSIWPSSAPIPGETVNMNWPDPTSRKNTSGVPNSEVASTRFSGIHGLWRIEWNDTLYGISNKWATMNWFAYTGNTVVEDWGLNQDCPMHNIAVVFWDEDSGGVSAMKLKWYDLEPASGPTSSWRWLLSNSNREDPDWVPPQAPYQAPANITWYGERIFLGEVTSTISRVSGSYIYDAGNSTTWSLDSPGSAGTGLRIDNNAARIRLERPLSTYNEAAYDYVRRSGRHIVTIERNDYDPGNEYIIAGVDNADSSIVNSYYVYPPTPSNSSSAAVDITLSSYSDNPADQNSLTVVTGENVTYRIYEDII